MLASMLTARHWNEIFNVIVLWIVILVVNHLTYSVLTNHKPMFCFVLAVTYVNADVTILIDEFSTLPLRMLRTLFA